MVSIRYLCGLAANWLVGRLLAPLPSLRWNSPLGPVGRSEAEKYAAMRAATVALATSGTVSTELALAGAPMVIGYRFQPLSYALMKPFFTGKYATLFNHAAEAEIAPELIQKDATPEKVARAVQRLLSDPEARAEQAAKQTAALDLMGRDAADPSQLAGDAVLRVIAAKAAG